MNFLYKLTTTAVMIIGALMGNFPLVLLSFVSLMALLAWPEKPKHRAVVVTINENPYEKQKNFIKKRISIAECRYDYNVIRRSIDHLLHHFHDYPEVNDDMDKLKDLLQQQINVQAAKQRLQVKVA